NAAAQMHVPMGGGFPSLISNNPTHVNHVVDLIHEHVRTVRAGTPFASCWLLGCYLAKVPTGFSPWGAVLAEKFPHRPFYSFNNIMKVLPGELDGPRGVTLNPMTFDGTAAEATALLGARAPGIVAHQFDSAAGALRPVANTVGAPGLKPLNAAHANLQ